MCKEEIETMFTNAGFEKDVPISLEDFTDFMMLMEDKVDEDGAEQKLTSEISS